MALTTELLNANGATAGLTDEQKSAIVEMSRNDETAVIGQKTGEIYGGLDADILAASGIWWCRALSLRKGLGRPKSCLADME